MARKRKLTAAFCEIPQEKDALRRSWRGGEHLSDWTLVVGPKDYKIHKVIVATGPRASAFLAVAFREPLGDSRERTDLTGLIPKSCWHYMDALLDFIYDGDNIEITVESWGSFVKMADILQIGALYTRCVEAGSDLISHDSAPKMAQDAVELELGGELQQEVVEMCLDAMAPQFSSYNPGDLVGLPPQVFQALLVRDDLEVVNEDQVFDFLLKVSSQLDRACMSQMWRCCRLHMLSPERVLEVALIQEIPKEAVVWALAQQSSPSRRVVAPPSWVGELACSPVSPRGREIVFRVPGPGNFANKKSLRSPTHSLCPRFGWRLLVFPLGTESTGMPRQVAAFVEIVPDDDVPRSWRLKQVKYSITVVHWSDNGNSVTKDHTVDFSASEIDSGWHRGWVPPDALAPGQGWLNDAGELIFRARCCVKGATATGLDPQEQDGAVPGAGEGRRSREH